MDMYKQLDNYSEGNRIHLVTLSNLLDIGYTDLMDLINSTKELAKYLVKQTYTTITDTHTVTGTSLWVTKDGAKVLVDKLASN